ncbi:PLP-dependent aminotransferase family protein [Billgrantia kenyensis]|uniref:PLP-dependent aminotransferase family protein n=1 Tax=Billgrantia kenyensis TaxID=321266 RepID=A0A7V9W4F7_9GAMM|nr:PLP-dependent aminotransferase family protein [Halomonas kenyensis]MBA2780785.1 PLP-dependent aminotransferase family protein [Halomonas kenyensis]MCG6663610.1 PLP-dependent aminotransferase family protein [Halomonas kenyensis]
MDGIVDRTPLSVPACPGQAEWLADALDLTLAEGSPQPLATRLYQQLREWIQTGRLACSQRLPSSRQLARELGLGRNTVLAAFDQLLAEGFLVTRHGAGTFVADLPFPHTAQQSTRLPAWQAVAAGSATSRTLPARGDAPSLSTRGTALLAFCHASQERPILAPGLPALDRFPHGPWQRLVRRHQQRMPRDWLAYQAQGGVPALREALADYLQLSRSVRCRPEQILIVQGAQQGFELIARLLSDPGDKVWIEEPGYPGAQACFAAAGLDLQAVPVDDEGMSISAAACAESPRLIYVTPSHQYPSGATMSLSRRLALLEAAERHGAWVVEDDYDSEFRYGQRPIAALQGLIDDSRVIYVGTFSKVMYPGLRLGYVVLPESLVEPFRRANARLHREGQYPVQAALAEFIVNGQFSRHIRRMRDCYRRRQALLRKALAPAVARGLRLSDGQAGMHLVAWLDEAEHERALLQRGVEQGISLSPLSNYYLDTPARPGLVLGYAGTEEAELERAGRWLAREWLNLS